MLRFFGKTESTNTPYELNQGKPFLRPLRWPFLTWLRLVINPFATGSFLNCIMGMVIKMARVDGAITERELYIFTDLLEQEFALSEKQRMQALNAFLSKQDFLKPFDEYARKFYRQYKRSKATLENAFDILLAMAYSDNKLTSGELEFLATAAAIFRLSPKDCDRLAARYHRKSTVIDRSRQESTTQKAKQEQNERMFRDNQGQKTKAAQSSSSYSSQEKRQEQAQKPEIKRPARSPWWEVLDCLPSDKIDVVKKKYRNLVLTYHPDRQPKEIPEGMKRASTQRFIEIQEAYEDAVKHFRRVE